jgi:hypothetical protein
VEVIGWAVAEVFDELVCVRSRLLLWAMIMIMRMRLNIVITRNSIVAIAS